MWRGLTLNFVRFALLSTYKMRTRLSEVRWRERRLSPMASTVKLNKKRGCSRLAEVLLYENEDKSL
jgi:hypothetical protein